MDTSGSPVPDAIHPLLEQLQEVLVLEVKHQPNLELPVSTQVSILLELSLVPSRVWDINVCVCVVYVCVSLTSGGER